MASVRLRTLDILGIALASSTSDLAPSVLGASRCVASIGSSPMRSRGSSAWCPPARSRSSASRANPSYGRGLRTTPQFSLAYSVAAALVDGRVGLDTYAKDRISDELTLGA